MVKAKWVLMLCFNILVAAGALACVLVWLDIKPKDLHVSALWPHWMSLIGALILFSISVGSSSYSLIVLLRRNKRANLVIHSAFYGTGPLDDREVTERLKATSPEGLVVPIDNNFLGCDPAPMKQKRLKVEYSFGNTSIQQVLRLEGGRLVLPEDSEIKRLAIEVEQVKKQPRGQIMRAGVLYSKAGQADYLVEELEKVWYLYTNENDRLIYPLGKSSLPDSIQQYRHKELFRFRTNYRGHIGGIKSNEPAFRSDIVDGPYPWEMSI
jgi:hypothetical protein